MLLKLSLQVLLILSLTTITTIFTGNKKAKHGEQSTNLGAANEGYYIVRIQEPAEA